ncbi:MAG: hypothetical protein E3J21_19105 [Anaerolineales bacterium]|nr:MAG: hypothetical protein E3J21_19105 [Anaerolineales bacterium]
MKKLLTLAIVLSALLIAVPVAQADTLCVNTGGTGSCYSSIQDAIDAASDGDTINVAAGTYAETLNITTDNLSIIGAGRTFVTIDVRGHASNNSGIYVPADGVTLQGFTLVGGPSVTTPRYGIKFGSSDGSTLNDVLVRDCYRTGVDILGASNLTISNVEAKDNGGNGLQACDANGVTFSNITTSGNAWGGVGIFTYGKYTSIGTDDIVFSGTNSFGETSTDNGGLYLEEGNYGDPPDPYPITYSTNPADNANVTVLLSDFTHTLHGDSDNNNIYTRFYATLNDAVSAAGGSPGHITTGRYIRSLADGSFYVANGMSIQDAIDAASDGDTINVAAGTYNENVNITKALTLKAASKPVIDGGLAGPCVTIAANGVTIDGFEIKNGTNGIVSWDTDNSTIKNCDIHDNLNVGGYNGVGIMFWTGTGTVDFDNNSILDNRIYSNDRQGIYIGWLSWPPPTVYSDGNTIRGNTIYNNGLYTMPNGPDESQYGIQLCFADNNTIQDNEIYGHNTWGFGQGIYLFASYDNTVTGNNIHGNSYGINLWTDGYPRTIGNNHINHNSIAGNGTGLWNIDGAAVTVDAKNNWWGDETGPMRQLPNGKWVGKGDKVISNVDYIPRLPHPIESWHHLPHAQ